MPQQIETALIFILAEITISTILFLLAYQKSAKIGLAITGLLQGMLSISTILAALGIRDWIGFFLGSILIFAGGLIGAMLGLLIYASVQKSKNPMVVDAKTI